MSKVAEAEGKLKSQPSSSLVSQSNSLHDSCQESGNNNVSAAMALLDTSDNKLLGAAQNQLLSSDGIRTAVQGHFGLRKQGTTVVNSDDFLDNLEAMVSEGKASLAGMNGSPTHQQINNVDSATVLITDDNQFN